MPRSSSGDNLALSLSLRSSAVLLLGLCLPGLSTTLAAQTAWSFQAQVIRVIDGDTLEVVLDGRPRALDLEEIETPELHEDLGADARQATSDLALGKTVRVEVRGRGAEGRWPAVVVLPDGRRLDHELVRRGLARWRGWCRERGDPELGHLEEAAREAGRGIWGLPGAEPLDACREAAPLVERPPRPPPRAPSRADCIPRDRCCRLCSKGKACGNSCISRSFNCHKGRGCACNVSEICG